MGGESGGKGPRAHGCKSMPVAEALNNSQAAHCKRSSQEKANSAFTVAMELACSITVIACLFQVLSRVHNCTWFTCKRQRHGIHAGVHWIKVMFHLGQPGSRS